MIIVKLMGGLGNQMFQYAAARRLAEKHGTKLKLDVSLYNGTNRWPYELERFGIVAERATEDETREAPRPQPTSLKGRLKRMILGAPGRFRPVVERGFSFELYGLADDGSGRVGAFNERVLSAPDDSYLLGFWQSEKYFADAAELIRRELTLKAPAEGKNAKMAAQIEATPGAVSLHVRRGDYIQDAGANKFHGTTTLDYYRMAIEQISAEVGQPHFFVFSDEPDWCRENLKTEHPMTFVDHNPPAQGYEDMRLMSLCRHHIIANSSFSWWGAWLNPREGKIVYGPKQWFRESKINTDDIIPESWRKI